MTFLIKIGKFYVNLCETNFQLQKNFQKTYYYQPLNKSEIFYWHLLNLFFPKI
jgi:hypothetical protein